LAEGQHVLDDWQQWLHTAQGLANLHDYRHCVALLHFERREFDQAERIWHELLNEDLSPLQRARALLELGATLCEQGQFYAAEQVAGQAPDAFAHAQRPLGQARAYNNLGTAITYQVEQGSSLPVRLTEAVAHHQTALAILADLLRDEAADAETIQTEIAHNQHGLGRAYGLLGQATQALAAFQQDLAHGQDEPVARALTLSDLAAYAYLPLHQPQAAAQALDEAITLLHTHGDLLHLAEALTRRGNLWVAENQPAKALADYETALQTVEAVRARMTVPTVQAGYRTTVEAVYAAPLTLHLRQGDYAQAFAAAERARARVLSDLLAGQSAQPQHAIPAGLLAQRQALHQQLDQAYAAHKADHHDPSAAAAGAPLTGRTLASLEAQLARVDRHIELADPAYAALQKIEGLSLDEVRRRLPADAALLTYVIDSAAQFWILLVSAQGIHAEPIPDLRGQWLQGLLLDHLNQQRGQLGLTAQKTLLAPRLYPALYQKLIAPVWSQLALVKTVYIIPTGPLAYVPIGALTPQPLAPPPLLAAGRRVVYAPSATILLNYCQQRPPSPHRNVLALAPQDDGLKFTVGAAHTITRLANDLAITGAAATRQALLTQADRYRVLAFLGHAQFNAQRPMLSHLKLADGTLHADQILRELRLNADLVILAACESGRSQVLRGDEMLGLTRSLLYAGTPALLVTLWKVHEIPTRLLVENFFAQLDGKASMANNFDPAFALAAAQGWLRTLTATAVRQLMTAWGELSAAEIDAWLATLWQITQPGQAPQAHSQLFRHPFFWSPFILIGDQRSPTLVA